jgi:hypothetical protein
VSVSSATLNPTAVVYREEQNFAWWIYVLLGVMVGLGCLAVLGHAGAANPAIVANRWGITMPLGLAIGLTLPSVLVVRVWFGWIPTYRHSVPLTSIERIEVVHYRPFADYGFWGARWGKDGERVLIAKGDRGVRLCLSDGTRLLIGSQKPEVLAVAIEKAMRPAA